MKPLTKALCVLLLCLGSVASAPALAHGSVRFGIGIGVPLYPPAYYYPPPPYYYQQPVVVQSQPPVYIERAPAQAAAPAPEQFWYYCGDSKTYYPYVRECASPWQRVSPQPPVQ